MKIQIEESALDSLKAMAQQLQDERDELLQMAHNLCVSVNTVAYCYDRRPVNFAVALSQATDESKKLDRFIAKCTAKPEVLE